MSIRFIYGRAKTGKTIWCLNQIKKNLEENNGKNMILLVPEQYSFFIEEQILNVIGEKAFFKTKVLTFKKMADEVLTECGGCASELVSKAGRSMLIYKVLSENMENLTYFRKISKQPGFYKILSEMIAEMKKFNLNNEILDEMLIKIEDAELKDKIKDLSLIFKKFNEAIEEGYIDIEDKQNLLIKKLQENDIYKNTEIWIDEFVTFTPQQMKIIKMLAERSERVNITLCTDKPVSGRLKSEIDVDDVFFAPKNTAYKLKKIAYKYEIPEESPVNLNENKISFRKKASSDEILHIEKNFFKYPYKKYEPDNQKVKVYKAENMYDEIEHTAKIITNLIQSGKYRYRDISVACRNRESYEKIMVSIFDEYNIPYFIDKKISLINNPLIVIIESAFEIMFSRWSYESIFKYLKTGLMGINIDDIDELENFILRYGIKGRKWTAENLKEEKWYQTADLEDAEKEKITDLMDYIRKPLIKFHEKMGKKNKVINICTAVYEFLTEINIYEKLEDWIEKFEENKIESKVIEYKQAGKIVKEILDQAVQVMGEKEVEIKEFFKILNEGFENEKIGVIPVALDQITIGDVSRIKGSRVKALFIVGVNDGIFPAAENEEGILSDKDKETLNNEGLKFSNTTKLNMYEEEFTVYTALTISEEHLYISYPSADLEGKSLRPSVIISKIKKMMPKAEEAPESESINYKVSAPIPTFNELILSVRKKCDDIEIEDYWSEVYEWYSEKEEYEDKIQNVFNGIKFSNLDNHISKEKLKKLYADSTGKLKFSVSKIEKYARCPFSYFVEYGLKARKRKVYEFAPVDMGSFIHGILDLFVKKVLKENLKWKDLNQDECERLIDEIIQNQLAEDKNSILNSSKMYKNLVGRFKRVITKSVSIMAEQLAAGEFDVYKTEFEFGSPGSRTDIIVELSDGEKIYLQGKIDRVDTCTVNDKNFIKIVDYKTGNTKFNINEVYYGLQMQLLLYIDAIIKNSEAKKHESFYPAAVFYFKIDDPLINKDEKNINADSEKLKEEIKKQMKLNGILVKDEDVTMAMDENLKEKNSSLFIPAGFKKAQGSAKNKKSPQTREFTAKSSAIDEEKFNILREYVNVKIETLCEEMLSGNVKLNPSKEKNNTACDFCEAASICLFDEEIKNNTYKCIKNVGKISEDKLWNKIEKFIDVNKNGNEVK